MYVFNVHTLTKLKCLVDQNPSDFGFDFVMF